MYLKPQATNTLYIMSGIKNKQSNICAYDSGLIHNVQSHLSGPVYGSVFWLLNITRSPMFIYYHYSMIQFIYCFMIQ